MSERMSRKVKTGNSIHNKVGCIALFRFALSSVALFRIALFRIALFQFVLIAIFFCAQLIDIGVAAAQQANAADEKEEFTAAEKLFALKVQPLIRAKCFACHGEKPDEIEGEFKLTSREELLKGGETYEDEVLIPGDSSKSLLYQMINRHEDYSAMPPKEAEKLSQEEVWAFRDWIDGGAPWPNAERVKLIYRRFAKGVTWPTSGGLSEEWTERKYDPKDLWSFKPLNRFEDRIKALLEDASENPIDAFIDAKLTKSGIESAPKADRRKLIRRATYDLTGLPPTPGEIKAFVDDPREDAVAFGKLIDRLLQSKHYGEQWGRHWLDVVRYADSSGFANDWERPNAWRYRDYVVRAFNQDKPYNIFVKEQIAGDEMAAQLDEPDPTKNQRAAELFIATGFLRMGPWEHTGMSVAKVTRQQFLDDVTDSVGQVFLGHALQCCRCHDHKFDPIPTRDYYAIQAVFSTTQFGDTDTRWLPSENQSLIEEDRKYKRKKLAANRKLLDEIAARDRQYQARWFKEQGLDYKTTEEAKKEKVSKDKLPPRKIYWTPDDFGQERIGRKWSVKLNWEMQRYQPIAFAVYSGKTQFIRFNRQRIVPPANPLGKGVVEKTAILTGGDVHAPSTPVQPAVLSAAQLKWDIPTGVNGRRLAFANWLADRKNPITARVMVNRVWQHHFGSALAGNPNNFGATGKKPTHPELLDWLSTKFAEEGWSVKKLHRLIMSSRAYQRSSSHPQADVLAEKDPNRELYAVFQPRRLSAEELRDSMLAVSGELNREMGGIPCRPDMNLEAALQPRMIMGTFAPAYVPHPKPDQRNRRTIYALTLRGQRDPFLETFNQPGSEKSCELRDRSLVAPQALTLLNSDESYDRAISLADAVFKSIKTEKAKLDRSILVKKLFGQVLGREPSQSELESTLEFLQQMEATHAQLKFKPREFPKVVERTANEENTGQPFQFRETLFEYQDYVPDLQASDVDKTTRALADVALALLNSNEFVTIE